MWRSSSPRRGFSLIELVVSMAILTTVILVPMYLLFTMRSFAERQQFYTVPRQAARSAVDYLSYYLEGATDLNEVPAQRIPNALIMYYNTDASNPGSTVQASYNNLTGSEPGNSVTGSTTQFGDPETDIINVSVPTGPALYPIVKWPGDGANLDVYVTYTGGCTVSDAQNLANFQAITGNGASSNLAIDSNGNWQYFKVVSYVASNCADLTGKNIHITASPGQPPPNGPLDPPNGHPNLIDPVSLATQLQFYSFRIKSFPDATGTMIPYLQQKTGLFDPNNPDTGFVTIMENVEDFQIAYMYQDGTIWNTANPGTELSAVNPAGIPTQAGPLGAPGARDIINVIGLRFSVTARSNPMTLGVQKMTSLTFAGGIHIRPVSEDHAAAGAVDNFEHYRLTTTVVLRNRILGS